jgi:hypothetical protein
MPDHTTVEKLIADVDTLLEAAKQDRDEAEQRIQQLEMEKRGLSLTLSRLSVHEVRPPAAQGEGIATSPVTNTTVPAGTQEAPANWVALKRATAVQAALQEIGRPANRNEVAAVLHRHGRDDAINDISATLSYLKRTNAADSKDGRWILLMAIGAAVLAGLAASSGGVST